MTYKLAGVYCVCAFTALKWCVLSAMLTWLRLGYLYEESIVIQ
jgi:hypothetical protein